MHLMVSLSKGNLDFSPFMALVPFPQVELPTPEGSWLSSKNPAEQPRRCRTASTFNREKEAETAQVLSGLHHLNTLLPVTH